MKTNINDIELINEDTLKDKIYTIRGVKVMLDFDLAKIYGYTTKTFNQQIKNNIERFESDFMFRIDETDLNNTIFQKEFANSSNKIKRSKILTTNLSSPGKRGGSHYLPYAFTEQGIYMLMTVLRGELAVKQSKALIRLFKSMKDYIVESNPLGFQSETIKLVNLVNDNTKRIDLLESKVDIVMNNFLDPSTYKHFLILDGQKLEANVAYQSIYSLAESTIEIVDDYISIKTLLLLKCCSSKVKVTIISDNLAKNNIDIESLNDFIHETKIQVAIKPNNGRFHDRYIFIDRKRLFHCGLSSKDAGNKITTIMELEDVERYRDLF